MAAAGNIDKMNTSSVPNNHGNRLSVNITLNTKNLKSLSSMSSLSKLKDNKHLNVNQDNNLSKNSPEENPKDILD